MSRQTIEKGALGSGRDFLLNELLLFVRVLGSRRANWTARSPAQTTKHSLSSFKSVFNPTTTLFTLFASTTSHTRLLARLPVPPAASDVRTRWRSLARRFTAKRRERPTAYRMVRTRARLARDDLLHREQSTPVPAFCVVLPSLALSAVAGQPPRAKRARVCWASVEFQGAIEGDLHNQHQTQPRGSNQTPDRIPRGLTRAATTTVSELARAG